MADLIIVDDDQALRDMLADSLSMAGHDIRLAGDAGELATHLADRAPELVLLDVSLPGEDGLSIARRLQAQGDIGIIMLTAADDVVDRIVGLEIGADDYVVKPFSIAELKARSMQSCAGGGREATRSCRSAPSRSIFAAGGSRRPAAVTSALFRPRSTLSPPSPPTPASF